MQLAKEIEDADQNMSPTIRAALIDSIFETSTSLLAGIIFVSIAAAMTALKTGNYLIWACVALLIVAGAARVLDVKRYQARKSISSAGEAAEWKKRYQKEATPEQQAAFERSQKTHS